ncbi:MULTISPECIES: GntR family transcriptional regulator [Nocardiopsidaceae]|uniref:GntR family transcriptional regulator n=1 Tax=Streptomonospora nanhaiensis TaxID=1323731 RepID=A0ABY6YMA1_9ACTN|nr:GntR family transcriptional regulator [Streptomonospora nanhaiensis]WAE73252.1 GntR family transcriptional regulator [Streptomonospora nanhaiensis]
MDTPMYTEAVPAPEAPPGDGVRRAGDPEAATATSRRDRVYALLREEVLSGRIAPRVRLGEVRLAELFGVSRTPVREALARLHSDGLVERRENGFYATVPNLAELRDLYELRVTLELRGISRAMEDPSVRHDPGVLRAELERWEKLRADVPGPDPSFVLLDEEFHAAVSRASGNRALTDSLVSVNRRIRRVRMYDFLTADRITSTVTEHIGITEHLLAGELDSAYRAMHEHVGASMEVVLERARRALTQMALHSDAL